MADTSMVFVVDDDASMCELIESTLQRAGLHVRTFPSAEAFVDANPSAQCPSSFCCLLLDLVLPGQSGLEFLETRHGHLPCPVIMITARGSIEYAVKAMKLGAVDFLEKPFSTETLTKRVLEMLKHHQDTTAREHEREKVRGRIATLTPRERELLDAIVRGSSNKIVAGRLGIAVRTAENHRTNLMKKMHAANVANLVRIAMQADYKSVKPTKDTGPNEPLPPTPW